MEKVYLFKRGDDVERPYHRSGRAITYRWHPGWCLVSDDGKILHPAMTWGEVITLCQRDGAIRRIQKEE